ncbi:MULTISPECIES: phospholipase D-like domain-containing protein [Cupriavidus]
MITAHFEGIVDRIVAALWQAQQSVRICVAWMSPGEVSHVLNVLADRGVVIEVAYYETAVNSGLVLDLARQEIAHYPVQPRMKGALMHHKFCIIDDAVLITGSYNWTKNARRHFENIVIAEHEFELVRQFKHEFEDIKEFVRGPAAVRRKRCSCCFSPAYHLAVFYLNDGRSPIGNGVWQICEWRRHAKLVASETYTEDDEIDADLGDTNDHVGRVYSVEDGRANMLRQFEAERESMRSIRLANARRFKMPIDAYGFVRMKEEALHLKGGGGGGFVAPEYEIVVQWRDVYYRKTVPDILTEDGGFEAVIRGSEWSF